MVKVTKNFSIDSDEGNFIVLEKSIATKGKNKNNEIQSTYGYYTTFEGALQGIQKALIKKKINKFDMDLNEAINTIKKINDKLTNITKTSTNLSE